MLLDLNGIDENWIRMNGQINVIDSGLNKFYFFFSYISGKYKECLLEEKFLSWDLMDKWLEKRKKRRKIENWVDRENMSPEDKGLPYKDALWLSKSQCIQTVPSAASPNSADACSNSQAKYLRDIIFLLLTARVQLIRDPIVSTPKYFQTKPPQTSLTLIAAVVF